MKRIILALILAFLPQQSAAQLRTEGGTYKCTVSSVRGEALTTPDGQSYRVVFEVPLEGRKCLEALGDRAKIERLNLILNCHKTAEYTKRPIESLPGCKEAVQ